MKGEAELQYGAVIRIVRSMMILLLILIVCALVGVKTSRFYDDYCGQAQSAAIKGIFAVIILFSHMRGYITLTSAMDLAFDRVLTLIGQLMVAMFFFYSGFGITRAWKEKPNYSKGFCTKRILKVLLHFDLAVFLFLILNLMIGSHYSVKDYLFCWIGWTAIGNSNWFVFDTLLLYLLSFVAMKLCEKVKWGALMLSILVSALSVVLWLVLYRVRGAEQAWWYDTLLCFPAGMCYASLKHVIDPLARKPILWWLGLVCLGAVFVFFYIQNRIVLDSINAAVFSILLVWITMKVKIGNKLLYWLGANSFAIYILQRIPMSLLAHWGINQNPYLFAVLTMVTIFPMSAGFTWLLNKVDEIVFYKKKNVHGKV